MNREEKAHKLGRRAIGLRSIAQLIGLALVIASIVRELSRPKEERTWHGVVFGKIPYDLRPPTIERFKATIWNPRDSHLLAPRAFGVGWTVNLAALRNRLTGPAAA